MAIAKIFSRVEFLHLKCVTKYNVVTSLQAEPRVVYWMIKQPLPKSQVPGHFQPVNRRQKRNLGVCFLAQLFVHVLFHPPTDV